MKRKTEPTWQAQIFCGLRVGYTEEILSFEKIRRVCYEYVNLDGAGWCVTVTPTEFIYKDGSEPGAIIGIISYPRFSLSPTVLRKRAIELAKLLIVELQQFRISIVFPDETLMIEKDEV